MNKIFKEIYLINFAILVNLIFLAYSVFFYLNTLQVYGDRGWLPQPFSFYRMDIFMDFYNVSFHALTTNFYTEPFRSIYTYVFRFLSQILIESECKTSVSAMDLRDCDPNFIPFYIFIFVMNFILLLKILNSNKYKYLWSILFMISFPMLYAFERGNYIVLTMTMLNMLVLCSKEKYFNLILLILPLTKLYFLSNYFIFFLMGLKNFLKYAVLFIILMLIGCLIYNENQFLVFKNLMHFSNKDPNIFELLVATSLTPLIKYSSINSLNIILKIFFVALLARFYIYITLLIERELKIDDYKFIVLLLLLLTLIIVESTGFYAIILLYPFFAYLINNNNLDDYEKIIIILLSIPYPINLFEYKYLVIENIQTKFQFQSIFIPLLLIIIFIKLTAKHGRNENRL